MTRSLEAIWRGEFLLALRYHPLGFAAFAFMVVLFCGSALYVSMPATRPTLDRWTRRAAHPAVSLSAFVLLIAVWVLRLLDWFSGYRVFLW